MSGRFFNQDIFRGLWWVSKLCSLQIRQYFAKTGHAFRFTNNLPEKWAWCCQTHAFTKAEFFQRKEAKRQKVQREKTLRLSYFASLR